MMEIESSKKFQKYNDYIDSYSASKSTGTSSVRSDVQNGINTNSTSVKPTSHPVVTSFGVSVRQKTNKVSQYVAPATRVSTSSNGIPPRYQSTTTFAASSPRVAIISPDNTGAKTSGDSEGYSFVEDTERLTRDYRNSISTPSVAIIEPEDDQRVSNHSNQRNQKKFNSNSSYSTFQSASSQGGGGSRGEHSSATVIASNRLQQQSILHKVGSDSTTNRARSLLSQPKPTKKTANRYSAVHNDLSSKGKVGLVDRGEEGIQTKSCLTLKGPLVATRTPVLSGSTSTNFVPVGKRNNNISDNRSLKAKNSIESDKSNSKSKMPVLTTTASRFGWVRRKDHTTNYPGSTSGNISGGATSQASSSVAQVDEMENDVKVDSRPVRQCLNEACEDDVEFPPSSSWAESSLGSMQSGQLKERQQQKYMPTLKSSSAVSKNSIPSPLSVNPSSTPSKQNLMDLLTPPQVQDRGSDRKKIREYELEKRQSRRGLFEGEIEPEGVRGQEATAVANQRKRRSFFAVTNAIPTPSTLVPAYKNTGLQQPLLSIPSSTSNSSALVLSRDFASPTKEMSVSTFRVIASVSSESSSVNESSNPKPSLHLESKSLLAPTNSSISSHDEGESDSRYFKEDGKEVGATATSNIQTKPALHISYQQPSNQTIAHRSLDSIGNELVMKSNSINRRDNLHRQESNISESTCSDEAIQDMLPDFLPPLEASSSITKGISRESSTIIGGLYISTDDSSTGNRDLNLHQVQQGSENTASQKGTDEDLTKRREDNASSNENGQYVSDTITDTSIPDNVRRRGFDISIAKNAESVKEMLRSSTTQSPSNESSLRRKSYDLTSTSASRLPSPRTGQPLTSKLNEAKPSVADSPGTSTTGDISSTDSPSLSEVDPLNALAVQHVNAGRFDEALLVFTRVLQIHQGLNGANTPNPNTSSAYHNLGTVHAKKAQSYDQAATSAVNSKLCDEHMILQTEARASALQCFQAAARSARDSLGRNHPNVAVSLVRIGFLLLQSKQYDNADTTFSEALRIRLEHYGSEHSLVANLYNNLGVCRMHLGKFEKGLESLEEALKVQHTIISKARDNIVFESGGNRNVKDAEQDEGLMSHKLELADTLFNIGGLCLEWIRRDGDKYDKFKQKRRSAQACRAFEEALNIRLLACKNNTKHPSVIQVQNLLRTAEQYKMLQEQQSQVYPSNTSKSLSRDMNSSSANEDNLETPSSLAKNIHVQTLQFDSPHPKHLDNVDRGTDGDSIAMIESREAQSMTPASSAVKNLNSKFPVHNSPTDQQIRGYGETSTPSKSLPFGDDNTQKLESASDPKGATICDAAADKNIKSRQDPSIFRVSNKGNPHRTVIQSEVVDIDRHTKISSLSPPLSEILTMSAERDVDDGSTPISKGTRSTRIFLAPLSVSKSSSSRSRSTQGVSPGGGRDNSNDPTYNSISLLSDQFSPDVSDEGNMVERDDDTFLLQKPLLYGQSLKSWSYDGEENCLIRNVGVDSDHGRIHFPLLNNNSIQLTPSQDTADFTNNDQQRDIMVTQSNPAVNNKSIQPISSSVDAERQLASRLSLSQLFTRNDLNRGTSFESKQWGGSEVSFSTGNKDRDEIMNRARAILDLTNISSVDNESDDEESIGNEPTESHNAQQSTKATVASGVKQAPIVAGGSSTMVADVIEEEYLEDVVAPLDGMGQSEQPRSYRKQDIKELLKDPMTCLPDIHREASRQLANNNPIDAVHLFETILRCQRRRFGALHPDVASALHNVGLGHLRAQNHVEALKAFEEAARVRKGCLGKDHPLVAVSLVKVGITLLLLQRFEESLWSFREALSVRKNSLGPLHPSTARIYNNIGCVYVEFNEHRQARRSFEAALDTQRNALLHDPNSGPLMFGTATTLCNLGYLYRLRGMHEKATAVFREAAELQEVVLGKYHSTLLSTLDNLADSCCNSGNGNEAIRYYNMVLDRFQRSGTDGSRDNSSKRNHRAESILFYKMSRVHRLRNDREKQFGSLQSALAAVRAENDCGVSKLDTEYDNTAIGSSSTSLEQRLLADIRTCRELMAKEELKWI